MDPFAERLRHLLEITEHLRKAIDELLIGLSEQINAMTAPSRTRSRRRSIVPSRD
jgi:hypothetical protein